MSHIVLPFSKWISCRRTVWAFFSSSTNLLFSQSMSVILQSIDIAEEAVCMCAAVGVWLIETFIASWAMKSVTLVFLDLCRSWRYEIGWTATSHRRWVTLSFLSPSRFYAGGRCQVPLLHWQICCSANRCQSVCNPSTLLKNLCMCPCGVWLIETFIASWARKSVTPVFLEPRPFDFGTHEIGWAAKRPSEMVHIILFTNDYIKEDKLSPLQEGFYSLLVSQSSFAPGNRCCSRSYVCAPVEPVLGWLRRP